MEGKKTNWGQYTKNELIRIIEYIHGAAGDKIPFVMIDAVDLVREERYLALRNESEQLAAEAHAARMKIHELMGTGKDDLETCREIQRLSHMAEKADRAWQKVQVRIDHHIATDKSHC